MTLEYTNKQEHISFLYTVCIHTVAVGIFRITNYLHTYLFTLVRVVLHFIDWISYGKRSEVKIITWLSLGLQCLVDFKPPIPVRKLAGSETIFHF